MRRGWGSAFLIQLLHINVQRFRGGLVLKAHRLFYHSTLGLRVTNKRRSKEGLGFRVQGAGGGWGSGSRRTSLHLPPPWTWRGNQKSFQGSGFSISGLRMDTKPHCTCDREGCDFGQEAAERGCLLCLGEILVHGSEHRNPSFNIHTSAQISQRVHRQ